MAIKEVFRRFWPYARPRRRLLWVSLVFILVGPLVEGAQIWMFKLVIDDVLVPQNYRAFWPLAIAYIVLTLVSGVLRFLEDLLSTWVSQRFLVALRTDFFRHLQGLSLDFFDTRRLGDLVARITGDVSAIESFLVSGIATALTSVVQILVFAGALFYLSWELALVSLVVAPLFWFTSRRFSRLVKLASREKRRRSGSLSAVAEESLSNAALVQAYNRQDLEVRLFHRENLGSYRAEMSAVRLRALFTPVVDLIQLMGALAVIGVGMWQLSRDRLSLGGLLVFMTFLSSLYAPIRRLGRLSNTIYAASAGAERIIEHLDQQPAVADRPGAPAIARARGQLEVEGVSFGYPNAESYAVSDVSFRVGPGQTVALVGASGAGKSTIAKLLLRFHDPERGHIRLDGLDLRAIQLTSLRANIAVVLQETLIFDGTIRENIAYGREGATEEEIVAAARAADAHDFILKLPDGYSTTIGQRGRRLSGGQRQRVAIARAMVRDAPILILDEPTSGLDAESGERILEPLRRLMEGRTTIVISHNLLTVREATEIVVLDNGRVVERGRHDELVIGAGRYAQLYSLHASRLPAVEPT